MTEWRLTRQLDKARSRWRHARVLRAATLIWSVGSVVAVGILLLQRGSAMQFPSAAEALVAGAALALLLATGRIFFTTRDRRETARRVEDAFPDLDSSLLAALDVQPDTTTGRTGYLQDILIGQVLSHAYQHGWQHLIPARRLALSHVCQLAVLTLFGAAVWQLHLHEQLRASNTDGPEAFSKTASQDRFQVTIEPGDTEVERGTSLLVLARFQGTLPPEATLVYRSTAAVTESGAGESGAGEKSSSGRVNMSKALDDPLFGGSITLVNKPLEYYVEFDGQRSALFRVGVFEYPRVERVDAQLEYPRYTSLEDKYVKDVRQLTAVVGTQITVIVELNKQVSTARMREKDGSLLDLKAVVDKPRHYSVDFKLDRTRHYTVQLVDEQQRANKDLVELIFTAIPNQPPDLKLAAPAKDTQVSPLEELELKAKAFDDFGLQRVGLTYVLAGQVETELTLAQQVAGKERLELTHMVALEQLKAEPDQLLSYYFWAEDAGPDGAARRTSSDMFFAEVRPFEEIFRQGEQPPGGQPSQQQGSQNSNAAEKLADLQKEIINATWRLVRRETGSQPTESFGSDVALLVESQNTALQQTETLAEKVRDPQAVRHVDAARRQMNQAIRELIEAKEKNSSNSLRAALDAEQQAYQSLLKLRAREHQVMRGQRQAGAAGGGSSSRSQQQLDQLELKEKQNRYETERTAQAEQDPVGREMRQVLNRLKELARRQGDLNERVKELQTALQEERSPEQQAELRRQLKRLQEEQEQLLRDTEELQTRMDQPQNAERMADSRQQLDNARERVRQSSEALREGMVSQAGSAGTRAKEEFEQLRDEFRKQTSGQFRQEVRELTEQARQLDEREQQIAQELQQLQSERQPATSLRDGGEREKLIEGLGEQQQRADQLLERMRQAIQEAEGPQPLLAEQLYDTVRRTQQKNLAQNLETTREAIRRGLLEPARQQEESARNTIGELRAGIDRAAEGVLEDETEALRRAQGQLDDLSRALREELARNGEAAPNAPGKDADLNAGSSGEPPQQGQPGNVPSAAGGSPSPQSGQAAPRPPGDANPPSPGGTPQREPGRGTPGSPDAQAGGFEQLAGGAASGGGNEPLLAPFSGDGYRQWSDRLRDVEEMLGDPQLSTEAGRIRERARALRAESKRHSAPPNWDLVKLQVAEPLAELLDRVHTEVLKRTKSEMLVPLDRDPIPAEFVEQVRKYYERLGSGK